MKSVNAFILLLIVSLATISRGADVDIRSMIKEAIDSKQKKLVIPAGEYTIDSGKNGQAHLFFENANHLEIDGTGVRFIFTNPEKNGIVFKNCRSLVLRGFSMDYDPLPFTQGTITRVDLAEKFYDFKVDQGYLPNPTFYTGGDATFTGGRFAGYLFDGKTGKWKTDAYDLYPSKCTLVQPDVMRLNFTSAESVNRNNTAVGDRIVVSRRSSSGMRLINCEDSVVKGVTVFACGGIGIQEAGGNGGNRFTMTVTRGPIPKGATAPRLHSINADGFHSASVKKGPVVENSLFEWMGDDSIAIHGTYALVTAQPAPNQVTLSPKFELPFMVGDDLTIVDGESYKVKGTAKVTKIDDSSATEDAAVAALWEKYRVDQKGRKFHTLTLDQPMVLAVGDLITSPQRIGNGYILRNNTCRFHRARGIQIKAGDGVIENNTIEDVNYAGITLGPEFSIWLGSDYVKNVVVRGNTIRDTGRGGDGRLHAAGADIAAIAVRSLTLDKRLSPPENSNIVIENNTIASPAGLAMFLSSAKNLVVRNNKIIAPWSMGPSVAGKKYGVDPDAAIFVAGCEGVTFKDNTIDLTGGTAKKAVKVGAEAIGVVGADSGFTLKTASEAKAE